MSRLKRVQIHFHTTEGEVVTSTQLEFDGEKNEYLTADSIAWLMGCQTLDIYGIANSNELIMREKNGQQWLAMRDVIFMVDLQRD